MGRRTGRGRLASATQAGAHGSGHRDGGGAKCGAGARAAAAIARPRRRRVKQACCGGGWCAGLGAAAARAAPGAAGLGGSAWQPRCEAGRWGQVQDLAEVGPGVPVCVAIAGLPPAHAGEEYRHRVPGADRTPHPAYRHVLPSQDYPPEHAGRGRFLEHPNGPASQDYSPARARRARTRVPGSGRPLPRACRHARPTLDCLPGRARCARNPVSGSGQSPHLAPPHALSLPGCCPACARPALNRAPDADRIGRSTRIMRPPLLKLISIATRRCQRSSRR